MPFRADELRARFASSIEQGRLGHSYLLTGDSPESLENLALGLAGQVLDGAPQEHPDFHAVRPESKSRHITVDQVRRLTSFFGSTAGEGGWRVCIVDSADVLKYPEGCNALLKMLEEPPARSLLPGRAR